MPGSRTASASVRPAAVAISCAATPGATSSKNPTRCSPSLTSFLHDALPDANMCSYMVVCALYPRFELLAALGRGAGGERVGGGGSAPAEAYGIVRGMRLGEAMSRCPALRLIPPDPEGVRSLWNVVLDRLEAIGAAVESDLAGAAFFESAGIEGLHGGELAGVLAAA